MKVRMEWKEISRCERRSYLCWPWFAVFTSEAPRGVEYSWHCVAQKSARSLTQENFPLRQGPVLVRITLRLPKYCQPSPARHPLLRCSASHTAILASCLEWLGTRAGTDCRESSATGPGTA